MLVYSTINNAGGVGPLGGDPTEFLLAASPLLLWGLGPSPNHTSDGHTQMDNTIQIDTPPEVAFSRQQRPVVWGVRNARILVCGNAKVWKHSKKTSTTWTGFRLKIHRAPQNAWKLQHGVVPAPRKCGKTNTPCARPYACVNVE